MSPKVVVMCGSYRFLPEIQREAERLELENGYAVITILPLTANRKLSAEEAETLAELHLYKINLADAIYVVNVNGYIGEAVKREIAYAREKGKDILYFDEKTAE